jgi:hypothetical protein
MQLVIGIIPIVNVIAVGMVAAIDGFQFFVGWYACGFKDFYNGGCP